MSDRGTIVVVSEASTAGLLREILQADGYDVESVDHGENALEGIAGAQPHLIILDSTLPETDPFVLCEALRKDRGTFDVPVLFLTTDDDPEGRVRAVKLGDDLLTMPLDRREVVARVERQVTVAKVRMALRESEAKFRSVMESAIDAIISSDVSGKILAWNRAATALFGYSEDEAVGQPIELIIPDRFHEAHRQGMNRVSSGGPSHVIGKTVELAAVRKNGLEFPVELSLATWFLDDVRYFTGIIRDISERKQAEQKFRSVTESAIDAIISADHEGHIVSWNHAATRILGYSADEAIGRRLELIIPERFHEAHREGMARVTAGGESRVIGTTVELFACTKSGDEVPIELSLSTWTVRDERFYTGIIRDIGERKRAEEELRLSEQALRERSLALREKNEMLEQTLARLHEAQHQLIMQEKMASLGKLSAGMAHELNNPAGAARRSAAQLRETFRLLEEATWKVSALEFSSEQRDTIRALHDEAVECDPHAPDLDGMERSDREQEIEDWMEEQGFANGWRLAPVLVKLGYDRDRIGLLEHEFTERQLNVVIEWLGYTHDIHGLLADLEAGTSRIAAIVGTLKEYTYMDRAPIQSVDLHQGLDNTLVIFQHRLDPGVTVRREYAESLPEVEANGSELNQVWTSIIENALDAMDDEGTLVLRTAFDDPWAVVEIEDSGPGIPADIRDKVFDPFFTTKPPGAGTGLGLNNSHSIIVKKHGGQISVRSEPGKTCFSVRLPVEGRPDGAASDEG